MNVVDTWIRGLALAQAAILEQMCWMALTLQDEDKIDRLEIVYRDGIPPTVASRWDR